MHLAYLNILLHYIVLPEEIRLNSTAISINGLFFRICMLGERLMEMPSNISSYSDGSWCNKNMSGEIWNRYCNETTCDSYFLKSETQYLPAIPGIASGVIKG